MNTTTTTKTAPTPEMFREVYTRIAENFRTDALHAAARDGFKLDGELLDAACMREAMSASATEKDVAEKFPELAKTRRHISTVRAIIIGRVLRAARA